MSDRKVHFTQNEGLILFKSLNGYRLNQPSEVARTTIFVNVKDQLEYLEDYHPVNREELLNKIEKLTEEEALFVLSVIQDCYNSDSFFIPDSEVVQKMYQASLTKQD